VVINLFGAFPADVEIDCLHSMLWRYETTCNIVSIPRINRTTNASTSYEKVVKIGSVTSAFKKGACGIFATTGQKTGQKLTYPTVYLSNYWTNLYRTFTALVVVYVRITKQALVLWSLKGRCYGNQLILGAFVDVEIDCFHSSLWRSETEGTIAL